MAHLHALLATESDSAVLIKRGPGRCSGLLRWDRRSDTFEHGQWLKQKLDHDGADLSPDGKLFVYYVNTQNPNREHSVYRAVSRPPWLKALTFWSSSSWTHGPGTGMFFRDLDHSLRLYALAHAPAWDQLGIKTATELPKVPPWTTMDQGHLLWTRLQRDGWLVTRPFVHPSLEEVVTDHVDWLKLEQQTPTLERRLPFGWTLQQVHCIRSGRQQNQPISFQSFALLPPNAEPVAMPTWEWADFDASRHRLVWTADCTLFAAPWTTKGLGEPKALLDTSGMGFVPVKAPY